MDLYYILLIIYFIFFLGLSSMNLKWGLYLIVFSLPSYLIRFKIGSLPTTLLEAMILILFLVWLVKLFKNLNMRIFKQKVGEILSYREIRIFVLLSGLFLVVATVEMFVAPELRAAAGIWKAYFVEPILFLVVLLTTLNRKDLSNLFGFLCLSAFILSVVAIYQQITGNLITNDFWAAQATRRVSGVFGYPNALALYLAPLIVIFLGLWIRVVKQKGIKGLLILNKENCFLVFILGSAAVYFSHSKGALLGILAGIFFYAVFYKNYRKYFIGLLIVFILLFAYLVNLGKFDLRGLATVEGGDSVSTRIEMWQETWQMLKDRPILGAGLIGYQEALVPYHQKEYIEIYLYPHNLILNFWSELGISGLLIFAGIIIWFYWMGFGLRGLGEQPVILMASMMVILIHGLVDVPYFKNDLAVFFWLMVGMMVILTKERIGLSRANEV